MSGELKKSSVLFAHIVQNADRAEFIAGKPDDVTARPAQLALQGGYPQDRYVEMLLKKSFENVHEYRVQRLSHKDTIERASSWWHATYLNGSYGKKRGGTDWQER